MHIKKGVYGYKKSFQDSNLRPMHLDKHHNSPAHWKHQDHDNFFFYLEIKYA